MFRHGVQSVSPIPRMKYGAKILLVLMLTRFSGGLGFAEPPAVAASSSGNGDYVVLMHGLIRSATAMKRIEWAFEEKGYRVINVNYPSSKLSIEDAARLTLARIVETEAWDPTVRIHFVTHSQGGIILRAYLANHPPPNLGRVVMIAPPNHGSELVDKFKGFPFFKFFTGPAGQELGTDADSTPQKLPPASFELGVIAGDRTLNPFYSMFLPGPDDGKVSVASTRLEGMGDFVVVHSSHTYLPWRRRVVDECVHFVTEGRFVESAAKTTTANRTLSPPSSGKPAPGMQAKN